MIGIRQIYLMVMNLMNDKQAILQRINYLDIENELPEVQILSASDDIPMDIFISSLGFEERVLAVPKILAENKSLKAERGPIALVCLYRTNKNENEGNREKLLGYINTFCKEIRDININSSANLSADIRAEVKKVADANPQRLLNIVFDISTASGNLILSIMHALIEQSHFSPVNLVIAYSEALQYLPTSDEYSRDADDLVLKAASPGDQTTLHEYGVSEVDINELYPGMSRENRPEFIIAVPSYRTERLSRCLQRITDEPVGNLDNFVHWVLGSPPSPDRAFRLDMQKRIITKLMQEMCGDESVDGRGSSLQSENHSIASTLDYRDILGKLVEKIDAYAGKNISVIHMGSKMQAVGIALALFARPEVSVCYARPAHYNSTQYSIGIGSAWYVSFGCLSKVAQSVKSIGTLKFATKIKGAYDEGNQAQICQNCVCA